MTHSGLFRRKSRAGIISFLGGKCVKCGFDDPRALHIDHVFSDGAHHRKTVKSQSRRFHHVRKFPERFQLLCANCNAIKMHECGEIWPVEEKKFNWEEKVVDIQSH